MQRLAILTFVSLAAVGWMALPQNRLVAFQTEPESGQSDGASEDAQTTEPGEIAASSAADPASAPNSQDQTPAAKPLPPPDPAIVAAASKLLRDARDRLYDPNPDADDTKKSVRAKFVERANFGGRHFAAQGTYVSGAFPTLRLEYRVRVGDSEGELIEVCDGNILRTSKVIRPIEGATQDSTVSQWTRKDIRQILQATPEGSPDPAMLQAELSLGGLPTLLASFERSMVFDTVREQVWQGKPSTIIEGRWRNEMLTKISQQMGASPQALAQMIPDRVRVYFDKETLFPTRILYRKRVSQNPAVYAPLLSIEFSDIQLNQGVGSEEFRYVPPKGVDEIDETAMYLALIEQLRAGSQAPADAQSPSAVDPEQPDSPTGAPEATPAQQPTP